MLSEWNTSFTSWINFHLTQWEDTAPCSQNANISSSLQWIPVTHWWTNKIFKPNQAIARQISINIWVITCEIKEIKSNQIRQMRQSCYFFCLFFRVRWGESYARYAMWSEIQTYYGMWYSAFISGCLLPFTQRYANLNKPAQTLRKDQPWMSMIFFITSMLPQCTLLSLQLEMVYFSPSVMV